MTNTLAVKLKPNLIFGQYQFTPQVSTGTVLCADHMEWSDWLIKIGTNNQHHQTVFDPLTSNWPLERSWWDGCPPPTHV